MQVDRWWYRAKYLYGVYDTDQKFDDICEDQANYSLLPAYYRNNVQLINYHQSEINRLGSNLPTAQPPAGRSVKATAVAIFALFVIFIVQRTADKIEAIKNPLPQVASAQKSEPAKTNVTASQTQPTPEHKPGSICAR